MNRMLGGLIASLHLLNHIIIKADNIVCCSVRSDVRFENINLILQSLRQSLFFSFLTPSPPTFPFHFWIPFTQRPRVIRALLSVCFFSYPADCNILLLPLLLFDPPLQTKAPSPLLIVSPAFVLLSRRSDRYIVPKDTMRTDSIALMKGKRFSSLSVSFPSHVSFVDTRVSTSTKRESETSCNERREKERKIECEVKA